MVCSIIDFRCIIVNELIGSAILAMLFLVILYFILASKLRFGFETTITVAFPIIIGFALYIYGVQIIYAFATILIGLLLAMVYLRVIGNK